MIALVEQHLDEIRALCEEFGVLRLELFGSATTGEFDPERSDLDFLVEFPPTVTTSDHGWRATPTWSGGCRSCSDARLIS